LDRQTDRGKTVYLPPPSGSGGIIKLNKNCSSNKLQDCSYNNKTLLFNRLNKFENKMHMK
jgi:hypothetical protein